MTELQALLANSNVVDRAIETAPLMLGSDKSRGYCLEMIRADFLAGANLENDNPGVNNVYRHGMSGVVKLNLEPITGTSYVDRTVRPGQTYFYVTKAVSAKGAESTASNEVRADVPSP